MVECGDCLGGSPRLHVGRSEVIGNVVAELASMHLSPSQRNKSFRVIMIENAGMSYNQPSQRACLLIGMASGVGFDTPVGCRRAIMQQLPRHGPQARRSHKRLSYPPDPRRHCFLPTFRRAILRRTTLLVSRRLFLYLRRGRLLLSSRDRGCLPEAMQEHSRQEAENQK